MKKNLTNYLVWATATLAVSIAPAAIAQEDPEAAPPPPPREIITDTSALTKVFGEAGEINEFARTAQAEITDINNETSELVATYDRLLKQLEGVRAYNAQQERLIASQEQEIAEYRQSIIDVQAVRRQITPLMLRMIGALEEFKDNDVPFLDEQRDERIQGLRDLMDRSDVSEAEKFRRVFEVYQIENEYGRTIDTYSGSVSCGGQEVVGSFMRIGRVVLAFESTDESVLCFYNADTGAFEALGPEYRNTITEGLRYANRQASPEIYALPINGPETVQ